MRQKLPWTKVAACAMLYMEAFQYPTRWAARRGRLFFMRRQKKARGSLRVLCRFSFFGQINPPKDAELTQMSYEFYPEALANVIRAVAKDFKGDIIVTENGIASSDDSRRVEFIRRALAGVESCIADGIPVKGYCHWSLLDNFEWQKGFSMTFGLIAVDRKTQTRYPKESLNFLGNSLR